MHSSWGGGGYSARMSQAARVRFGGRAPTRMDANSRGGTGHAGERMGEADHPGPTSNLFSTESSESDVEPDYAVMAEERIVKERKAAVAKVKPKPAQYTCAVIDVVKGIIGRCTSSMALLTFKGRYYVEVQDRKCRPFGGACKPPEKESFEAVNRTIAQAAGDCAYKGSAWVSWGPLVDKNIAYRGIDVKFEPVAQEGFEIRSFASLDEIRMKGGALHYRLGQILKILEHNKDNTAFFHSEQEEHGMSDGDDDISASPERGDVSDFLEEQEHDMGEWEQYEQWMRHNSTVRELEAATSQISEIRITSQGELEVVTSDHDTIAAAPEVPTQVWYLLFAMFISSFKGGG